MFAENAGEAVRKAAVAGQFYPRDPVRLRESIMQAFTSPLGPGHLPVVRQGARRLVGVLAPHAGYVYSAPAAAWSFAEVAADGKPEVVVLLGVNHRGVGQPLALSPAHGWETPLGVMPVATAMGQRLLALAPAVAPDAVAHAYEHSLEVQVPFLQALFGELPILPIAMGRVPVDDVRQLGHALATLCAEYDVLIVASSDLSHYLPLREAEVLDHLALQAIGAVDAGGLLEVVARRRITMCGVLPVAAMLTAANELGVPEGKVLHYHTSGAITGENHEVVGYGAAALYHIR